MTALTDAEIRALMLRYVAQVHEARRVVAEALHIEDPLHALQVLRERTWSGEVPRAGTFPEGQEYVVHGRIGVHLSWPDGVEVDVDCVGGVDTFDPWKLRHFCLSTADPPLDMDLPTIRRLLDTMAREGSLTMAGRFFVVPEL